MDLLLDTMCNTFGGVMFIAISLSLAFVVCQNRITHTDTAAEVRQELEKQQQETAALELRREHLNKRLSSLRELAPKQPETSVPDDLPEIVTALEQDCRKLKREIETQQLNIADHEAKSKVLDRENSRLAAENRERKNKLETENTKLRQESQKLAVLAGSLKEKLQNIPVKRFHFSVNTKTKSEAYVILIRDRHLFRMGTDYRRPLSDVKVRQSGDVLRLTPQTGIALTTLSSTGDLARQLAGFDKSNMFLWVMVHPDSFDSFVDFRRLLRMAAIPIFWYLDTSFIVYLGNKDYSASY